MKIIGLSKAKQKLCELVDRAGRGERIGITRRGKLVAFLVPADRGVRLKEVFARIEQIRNTAKPLPKSISIKGLIREGRR